MLFLCLVMLIIGGLYNTSSAQDSTGSPGGSSGGGDASSSPGYKMAVGIRFSTAPPTINNSISFKYFIDQTNAVEALASFGSRFGLGALYERHQLIGATPAFTWFYGGGAYVGFESGKTWFGPTGVVGLDYKFPNAPVNLSLDWKPELDIIPSINFVPDAFGLSARFTFGH
jgi:hypothetical protein